MPGPGGRTISRPPWVKDGPKPIPMPAAPWTLNSRRDSKTNVDEAPAFTKVTLKSVPKPADLQPAEEPKAEPPARKTSKITVVPAQPKADKNARQSPTTTSSKTRENGRSEPSSRPQLERQAQVRNTEKSRSRGEANNPVNAKTETTTGAPTLSKSASRANIPPPPPPRPPPPPPSRNILKDLPPLTSKQQKTIEMLKSRPRKRPDWGDMMKEVESGKKLRHVVCNDRSAPLIERVNKVKAEEGETHFIFNSEESNVHNKLLKEIQGGIKLKSVKTNDRSRPVLEGLRKFRRQMTIEEQIQKAEEATVDAVNEQDEMDDIDAVRDDLQSTKQMLALELRNKEALERDNKRLQARILNLEVELEREKAQKNIKEIKQQDQALVESLRKEIQQSQKDTEKLEKEYATVAEEKDRIKLELEEMKRLHANLEKRMKAGMALAGCPSAKDVARIAAQKSIDKPPVESESSEEEEESSEEESEEDEDPKAAEERRLQREIKLMKTKVKNFKHKTDNAMKERHGLKDQIKQQQKLLKEEKKKFKRLQKEVDKMAKLVAGDDDDDEEKEEEEEEETETEESESESEESEEEESDIENDNDPLPKVKTKLQDRVKKHEGRLASLKKGNYLLKAQVDRLKDDLSKQREESVSLQEDLDSVLAELG